MTQRRKRRATEVEKQAARRRGETVPVWVFADTGTITSDGGSYGGSSYDSSPSGSDSGSSCGSGGGCD